VSAFDQPGDGERLDFQLLMQCPVRLFHNRTLLDDTVRWLRENGYHVVDVDASWRDRTQLFDDLSAAFSASCNHRNHHCLAEGMDEAAGEAWGRRLHFALVLRGFDVCVEALRADAEHLLNQVADGAWPAALMGRRRLCLVQSDDPDIVMWPLSPWTPVRNAVEWAGPLPDARPDA